MFYQECLKKWRDKESKELINKFWVKFTYSSCKIENYKITYRDVEAIFNEESAIDFKGNRKIIMEIENYKQLFNNLLQLIKEKDIELSVNLMGSCYSSLVKGFSTEELIVKEEKLYELINKINDMKIKDKNALQVASYFVCSFELIKPFSCLNGRIVRILLNYILIGNKLAPIIIFDSDKKEYYSSLEYYYKTQDISRMIHFLDNQAYKTWIKNYNARIKKLNEFLD